MNRILVPCDFSPQAMNAVNMAVEIAALSGSSLHLLHVIEVPLMHDSMLMPTLSFEEETMKDLRANATREFEKIKVRTAQIPITAQILYGSPAVIIVDYIKEERIDLVVMGTKGASGLKELLIGSTAEKIVRSAKCSVITVRGDVSPQAIKNIVVPNSLEPEQEVLVTKLKQLQQLLKATLHVVWINTPANFTPDHVTLVKLQEFAHRYMLTNFTLNIYNDLEEKSGVMNFAKQKEADMIAMGTHGRKGISHLLVGSIAEDLVNHVSIPIWTTHM